MITVPLSLKVWGILLVHQFLMFQYLAHSFNYSLGLLLTLYTFCAQPDHSHYLNYHLLGPPF